MSSNKETSIREWKQKYEKGEFNSPDIDTQIKAGWWDWFCDDKHLLGRMKKMAVVVMALEGSSKINLDTQYIFFKNNCPFVGPTYDRVAICDRETQDVKICVEFDDKRSPFKYMVFDMDDEYEDGYGSNEIKDVINYLNDKGTLEKAKAA